MLIPLPLKTSFEKFTRNILSVRMQVYCLFSARQGAQHPKISLQLFDTMYSVIIVFFTIKSYLGGVVYNIDTK